MRSLLDTIVTRRIVMVLQIQYRREREPRVLQFCSHRELDLSIDVREGIDFKPSLFRRDVSRFHLALPTGDVALFMVDLAERIRTKGGHNRPIGEEESVDIGERLVEISELLEVNETDLEYARHASDITKTIRQVTKLVFPDFNDRRKMKISSMNKDIVRAIIGKARSLLLGGAVPTLFTSLF